MNRAIEDREHTIALTRLCKLLPDEVTYETLRYWCLKGRRKDRNDPNSCVRMESVKKPCGLSSSVEAYWRFIAALND